MSALAQKKLNLSIIASLKLAGKPFYWLNDSSKVWICSDDEYNEMEIENAKGIFWSNGKNKPRVLYYNTTVPIVKNNIDIILLNNSKDDPIKNIINIPSNFIALGELKGGIDPAGADEHWKTAKTAIDRISDAFKKHDCSPDLFYIGAAIESKMASEIFEILQSKYIKNAANLTKSDHITSIVDWILNL